MTEYGLYNHIELESMNPFIRRYVFVDTTQPSSDEVFAPAEVPVQVFDRLQIHENKPYAVVQCRIKKKHEAGFLKCMADLERKILLSGHNDYLPYCKALKENLASYEPMISFF